VSSKAKERAFRNEALGRALDKAASAPSEESRRALYDLLCRASGLPGANANVGLVEAFAEECAHRGPPGEALAMRLVALSADDAPGDDEREILPMCGVAAVGALAIAHPERRKELVAILHDRADDLRYRVRDLVPIVLADIGATGGDAFLVELDGWMDGYFHAAAVLLALADLKFSSRVTDMAVVGNVLDRAFFLLRDAPRSAARYPGHKSLIDAVGKVPEALAMKFGAPIFEVLAGWTIVKDPDLRELVSKNMRPARIRARYGPEVARVQAALGATAPPRRDPTTYVGKTRGRGKKHR
jgi:hypothetical protein